MKKIVCQYDSSLNWVEPLAKQLKGKAEGNFIKASPHIQTGNRYFFKCREGISALYLDIEYNTDLLIVQKSKEDNFIGIYYDLTDVGEIKVSSKNNSDALRRSGFDLSVIDGTLQLESLVKKGSRTFALCLFVRKDLFYSFTNGEKRIHNFFQTENNILAKFGRMSPDSYAHLTELRRKKVGSPSFDLDLAATVYLLISDLLETVLVDKSKNLEIKENDLLKIIDSERILNENLEGSFPGIEVLSDQVNMSPSKFKYVFKKVLKTSPQLYHMNNKLYKAKELLEQKELSVTQISEQFGFCNAAYFGMAFKKRYHMSPKVFAQQVI
ncbi:AraC family transcriptional regulator [Flavobacterium sp. WG21]|uniref:helix-turn-helix domain-containing protein n=1 Tax=Flavobacterium sp. WG21 TaxID=1229487 RepID=UPI000371EB05|nr:AraC family transcriptional regulator [Flavobacterium sp. WG21]